MRNFTRATAALIGAAALVGVSAVSASAAEDTTTATIAVTGGSLSITAPATLALSGVTAGATTSSVSTGLLEDIVVEDARATAAGWSATATLGEFASIAVPANTFVAGITYSPTVAVVTGGVSVVAPTADEDGSDLQTGVATGSNTATWDEAITVTVPQTALAATDYQATLTHSVL